MLGVVLLSLLLLLVVVVVAAVLLLSIVGTLTVIIVAVWRQEYSALRIPSRKHSCCCFLFVNMASNKNVAGHTFR